MPAYESGWFAPPAPLARVILIHPETASALADVPMLIDTGADVTLLPQDAARRLGLAAASERRYELVSFDGSTSTASVVLASLVLQGRRFRGQYLLIQQPWGILGRNILNAVPLFLDGPRLAWEIQPAR